MISGSSAFVKTGYGELYEIAYDAKYEMYVLIRHFLDQQVEEDIAMNVATLVRSVSSSSGIRDGVISLI